jgi:hypothetical protein
VHAAHGDAFSQRALEGRMSYDLFFKPRVGLFDQTRFIEYFRLRDHYEAASTQVWYKNEDTGVYFSVEFQETDPEALPVALSINFFRPTYFILEAEPEITDFVRHFDLVVSDPQIHGMGEGEYQIDLLISGWNHGNEFACSAFVNDTTQRDDVLSLPRAELMRVWAWNRGRKELQAQTGDSQFVPRVIFARIDQQVFSAAVWPDGISALIPFVDYLIVPRRETAHKRLFRRVEDRVLLAWSDAQSLLERYGSRRYGDTIALNYVHQQKDVSNFVRSLHGDDRQIIGVSADQVLDRELIEKYLH